MSEYCARWHARLREDYFGTTIARHYGFLRHTSKSTSYVQKIVCALPDVSSMRKSPISDVPS